MEDRNELLRTLPAVGRLLERDRIEQLSRRFPALLVRETVKQVIEELRDRLLTAADSGGAPPDVSPEAVEDLIEDRVRTGFRPSVRPAVNATGVILHTGLGRAPLAGEAREALAAAVEHYCTLEIDAATGERGSRHEHVERLLCMLTCAGAACVVNNNAAAVLLALNTLADEREVIVSRGQLVEIGGAFRMPDVMRQSGAVMVEVGTTNRTHPDDYRNAINERTAMVQAVHPSNYRIEGFTREVPLAELKDICVEAGIPLVMDIGSGCLLDFTDRGLPPEPVVADSVAAGADVVTFSGDKILGGPQCGVLAGNSELIDRMKANPLMRALRCGKMTYAALEATLKLYLDRETLFHRLPALRMATAPVDEIRRRSEAFAGRLEEEAGEGCEPEVIDGESRMGSGTMPARGIPTKLVAVNCGGVSAGELARRLRSFDPPVFARIAGDRVLIDLRTVRPEEEDVLVRALAAALDGGGRG